MLGAWGDPEFALANSHFQAYGLPERRACAHPNVCAQEGSPPGPNVSGEVTDNLVQPHRTPADSRKSSLTEVLGLLRTRGQFGFPLSMQTDACLGFCSMGYQSSGVARNHCDAFRRILIRSEGSVANRRDSSKQNWAQRAKVGYCPCCAKATQIALPPTYLPGENSSVEEPEMSLLAEDGPWAGRRLVALTYVMDYAGVPLPKLLGWAARSLESAAPSPHHPSLPNGAHAR